MPRIARGLINRGIYHVLNRGNARQQIFHKDEDYKAFIELMIEAKKQHEVEILGYCLMPNHFHIILTPVQAENLSKWMQWLMTSHVRRYHRHYKSSGHVWQGRFKSFLIQADVYLLMALRYVEANPIRAGLTDYANNWKWSSHKETSGDTSKKLVDEIPIDLPSNWSDYVNEGVLKADLDTLRQCVNRQAPYGDYDWQLHMCKKFGLESTLHNRGRPKKGTGYFL